MLDEEAIGLADRLRLIALYILFKSGILNADMRKLLLHAQLPLQDEAILYNLELLGARVSKQLKDPRPNLPQLFPRKQAPLGNREEIAISRYDTALKTMLEEHVRGTLDPATFPYVKPELAPAANDPNVNLSSASLRSAKPTWARSKLSSMEPRQRIIVFMAGGATYSEARACYEVSESTSRDVLLITSHMLNPGFFLQQLGSLSADRRALKLPADRPPKKAPAHVFEDDTRGPSPQASGGLPSNPARKAGSQRQQALPPTERMHAMSLNGNGSSQGGRGGSSTGYSEPADHVKPKEEKADQKKKKHGFFGSKR